MDMLDALMHRTDDELVRLRMLDIGPFLRDRSSFGELRASIKEWLKWNTLRNEPELKKAINDEMQRRRDEASAVT